MTPCPFCAIVKDGAPATIIREWPVAIAIVPLNPVVEGHTLVIPKTHVEDFTTFPALSAGVMWAAAELAADIGPCNLITSKGREATQSVFHLHLHIVPRAKNDGLALPWYSGKEKKAYSGMQQGEVAFSICTCEPGSPFHDPDNCPEHGNFMDLCGNCGHERVHHYKGDGCYGCMVANNPGLHPDPHDFVEEEDVE